MTPEEIKSHKGDTIILGADSLSHTRKGFSTLFAQSSIETLLKEYSFPIILLDSIFNSEIQKHTTCHMSAKSMQRQRANTGFHP